jgi:rhodanese-related sulfurtransferase
MIRGRVFAALTALAAGFLIIQPAQAASPTRAQIDAACRPGTDPQKPGDDSYPGGLSPVAGALTPQSLPGATTVSVAEAKCLIDRFKDSVVVIAAMNDEDTLPGAHRFGDAASDDPSIQGEFAKIMARLTADDKSRPILVYCHHEQCFLSYNVALRTVQAGYKQVFWMRPGLAGWKAAGYALAPKPPRPGEVAVSQGFTAERDRCRKDDLDYEAKEWAGMLTQIPGEAEQEAEFQKDRAEKLKWYKLCLQNLADRARGAADQKAAAAALAAADKEVTDMFARARAEVEANPAQYLTMTWDSHQPAKLRADLAAMRKVRTLAQACGTFDLTQPYLNGDNNYVRQLNTRRMEYGTCLEAYRKDDSAIGHTFGLSSANKWVKATRRFTCRASAKPNCIANGPFDEIAALATDENVRFVETQEKRYFDESHKVNDLIDATNQWIDTLNQRIDAYNASHS